jgi:hypothetical protein
MTQSNFHSDGQPTSDRFRDSQRMRDENLNHDDDTTFEDPRIARERAEERERAEAREAARDHAETTSHDDRSGFGTSYLGGRSSDESLEQWRQIQADFVDNPRSAVSNAHGLVGNLIDDIVRKFEDERNGLEQRWSSGQDVSTEDLRRCLQTYRDFFNRLLATNVGDAKA